MSANSHKRTFRQASFLGMPTDHLMRVQGLIDLPRPEAQAYVDGVVQSFQKIGGFDHDCNHRAQDL